MAAKLKVYRTPIGFHDAYVAAASQKAALAAWGTDTNLFARGVADLVTDPALTAEPLAHPGTVIKRARGTAAEHVAAAAAPARTAKPAPADKPVAAAKPRAPRPSRDALDAAEAALEAAREAHARQRQELDRREAALREERRKLDATQSTQMAELEQRAADARSDYDRKLEAWRG